MDVDDAVVSDILEILRSGERRIDVEDGDVAGIRNGSLDSVESVVEHEVFKVLSLGKLESESK